MHRFILLLLFILPLAASAQTPALDVENSAAETLLHLHDDAGLALFGTFGTGTIPATGAGTRLMWHPAKAAFRAGRTNAEWDEAQIGDYSVAMGQNTEASGLAAVALGRRTTASGSQSTALGSGTVASGSRSAALGNGTEASGFASTALGTGTTAQAYASLVVGRYNTISGDPEAWAAADPLVVAGNGAAASNRSNALVLLKNGDLTAAGQIESESGGFKFPDGTVQTTAAGTPVTDHGALSGLGDDDHGQYVLADGVRAATDGFAVTGTFGTGAIPVEGAGTRLMWYPKKAAFRAGHAGGTVWDDAQIGNYSVAMGFLTRANGLSATAMGNSTVASGNASTALGALTTASGSRATAMGENATASGYASTAMGEDTQASGDASVAMGDNTTASGFRSTAMGVSTTASGNSATALGALTTASGARATAMGSITTAQAYASLVIGRYNTLSGSTTTWVSTDPLFVAGNGASGTSRSDALTLLKNGDLTIAGTLTENSDRRLKTDIRPLTGALDTITALRAVRYRFREGTSRPEGEH
ncbi:MAG: tail fiber domain-containing protein, partial [Rhodothermales bacterium]|nr:tail fiber domain-containing protein [Rhodothermales bacterium]